LKIPNGAFGGDSKMDAAAVSAALVSIGGSFYAQFVSYIDPECVMGFQFSLLAIASAHPNSGKSSGKSGRLHRGLTFRPLAINWGPLRAIAPIMSRKEILQRDLVRVQSSMERLMTAYQEDLLSLDCLRRRMPDVRKREQAIRTELNAIENELADPATYLRLAQTVTGFLARLRETAKTLDVSERQRIVRLLVKEIIVADDAIIIRHSIPAPSISPTGGQPISTHKGITEVTFCVRELRHLLAGYTWFLSTRVPSAS
jgi:hypothetical protein